MCPNPATKSVRFAIFQASFPNTPIKTYLEVPLLSSVCSLESTAEQFKKWGITTQAFVTLEFLHDQLSETGKRLIDAYGICPEMIINHIKEPVIALVETLVATPMPEYEQSDIETIELQILNIEKRDDTKPGIYIETSHGHDIASDMDWWNERDFPGSVVGHTSIEIFNSTLVAEAQSCLEAMYLGEPEKMEQFIGDRTLDIAKKLLAA